MRITNNMMARTFLSNLNSNMAALEKSQYQVYTGKRLTKLSDDPVGILKSMTARTKLYRLEQHKENAKTAETWLTQAETNLMELNKIIASVYEAAVQVTSDTYNPEDKDKTASFIAQMRDHVLDLGNGQESELYIFSGYSTTLRPFSIDANGYISYKGLDMKNIAANDPQRDQVLQFEIGYGVYADVTITGIDFMGEGTDNIYNLMQDFQKALSDPNVDFGSLKHFIDDFSKAQDRVLAQISDIGGRLNRLDMVVTRYEQDKLTYTDMKSRIEDIDEAEAIMNFSMAEMVYQAALNVGARILQPSLLDYIR